MVGRLGAHPEAVGRRWDEPQPAPGGGGRLRLDETSAAVTFPMTVGSAGVIAP